MKNRERQRANRRLKRAEEKLVKCDLHNCAGNKSGYCRILKSNHFGDKVCPFYKTTEQNEKEKKAVRYPGRSPKKNMLLLPAWSPRRSVLICSTIPLMKPVV